LILKLLFVLSCANRPQTIWYEEATLSPPFEHGNSGWAGVALLDVDQDGWTDIFFSNGLSQPDALYRNIDGTTFIDISAQLNLDNIDQHGGVASGDLNNDGYPDLVVLTDCSLGTLHDDGLSFADGRVDIAWNRNGSWFEWDVLEFKGQALEFGICPISVELIDINNDGWLDIHVSNGLDLDQIYPWVFRKGTNESVDTLWLSDQQGGFQQQIDIFESITDFGQQQDDFEFQFVTFTSAFMDINKDGLLDKIAGFGGAPLGIYLQQNNGTFLLAPEYRRPVWGLWMGLAIADFDGDHDFDIYATNEGLSPYILGFDNLSPLTSIVPADTWLTDTVSPYHTMFLQDVDGFSPTDFSYENDDMLPGDNTNIDTLFERLTIPPLYDDSSPHNLGRLGWSWASTTIDINSDGWMDIVLNSNNCSAPMCILQNIEHGAYPGTVLQNDHGKGFIDVGIEYNVQNKQPNGDLNDGRGLAIGDLNNDGYSDIVYANRTFNPSQSAPLEQQSGKPVIHLSQGKHHNWLQIDLVGTQSNRDGIGSIIAIKHSQRTFYYLFEPGGTTNSSNERLFTIGLHEESTVDIAVRFPSGITKVQHNVKANQRLQIVE